MFCIAIHRENIQPQTQGKRAISSAWLWVIVLTIRNPAWPFRKWHCVYVMMLAPVPSNYVRYVYVPGHLRKCQNPQTHFLSRCKCRCTQIRRMAVIPISMMLRFIRCVNKHVNRKDWPMLVPCFINTFDFLGQSGASDMFS